MNKGFLDQSQDAKYDEDQNIVFVSTKMFEVLDETITAPDTASLEPSPEKESIRNNCAQTLKAKLKRIRNNKL